MNQSTQQPPQPHAVRSEGLLPADEADPALEIAEEVAFDLQSDQARQVGAMPPDAPGVKPAEAMAQALGAEPAADGPGQPASEQLDQAVERAVPPSP
ncbi:MAG: hypothetical protein V4723_09035 [Pseudomonadota bacterium]